MTNQERAALVTQEYRYVTAVDTSVKARAPLANDLEIDTNLDAAGAQDFATSLFARTSGFAQTYTIPIQGFYTLDDFAAQCPRFTLVFDRHPNINPATIFTVIGASIDYSAGTTTLTVRG